MRRLLAFFLAMPLLSGCETRPREIYEIPENFRGWVTVEYENPSCSALVVRENRVLLTVSHAGLVCTSSRFVEGEARDEYYLVGQARARIERGDWGRGGMVWGGEYSVTRGVDGRVSKTHRFFVGLEEDFKKATS